MSDFNKLVSILSEKKLKISAAESCTGGLFCASIVSVPSASEVFESGYITYSEKAKTDLVGVEPETIETYGVVSRITAEKMAEGAAKRAGADVGVGITGFAGPGGGDRFADVGTVCFGFFYNGSCHSCRVDFGDIGRNIIRNLCVDFACEKLLELIENEI